MGNEDGDLVVGRVSQLTTMCDLESTQKRIEQLVDRITQPVPRAVLPPLCANPDQVPDAKVMKVPVLPDLIARCDDVVMLELSREPTYLLLIDPKYVSHRDRMTMISELRDQGVKVVCVPVIDVYKAMVVYEAKPEAQYDNYIDESDPLVQHALREQDEGISDSLRELYDFENEDDVGPCGEE